jgi:hypothetical protein
MIQSPVIEPKLKLHDARQSCDCERLYRAVTAFIWKSSARYLRLVAHAQRTAANPGTSESR